MDRLTYWLERWRLRRALKRTGYTRQGLSNYARRLDKLKRRFGRD